jgi:hypothetical protein
MTSSGSSPAATKLGFAVPAKLLVFVIFMTQFVAILLGGGIYVPCLHGRGIDTFVLIVGSVAAFALFQVAFGVILRFVPVRCGACRNRAYFTGFGWWPFIYRFGCRTCGVVQRHEVRGQ